MRSSRSLQPPFRYLCAQNAQFLTWGHQICCTGSCSHYHVTCACWEMCTWRCTSLLVMSQTIGLLLSTGEITQSSYCQGERGYGILRKCPIQEYWLSRVVRQSTAVFFTWILYCSFAEHMGFSSLLNIAIQSLPTKHARHPHTPHHDTGTSAFFTSNPIWRAVAGYTVRFGSGDGMRPGVCETKLSAN